MFDSILGSINGVGASIALIANIIKIAKTTFTKVRIFLKIDPDAYL